MTDKKKLGEYQTSAKYKMKKFKQNLKSKAEQDMKGKLIIEQKPQRTAEDIIIEKVGEFWWVCGKHRPEFLTAMHEYAQQFQKPLPINEAEVKHPIDVNGKINKKVTYCFHCGTNVIHQKYCHGCGSKLIWY